MSFDALPKTKPSVLLHSCVATGITFGLLASVAALAAEPVAPAQQLLLQQQRERAQREQLEPSPDVRLQAPQDADGSLRLSRTESPCFKIDRVILTGDQAEDFQWALRAANPSNDPVQGRCIGAGGINLTMKRIQNAIIAKGFITTRVLAQAQDLNQGTCRWYWYPAASSKSASPKAPPHAPITGTRCPRPPATCLTCAISSRHWRTSSVCPPPKPMCRSNRPRARMRSLGRATW